MVYHIAFKLLMFCYLLHRIIVFMHYLLLRALSTLASIFALTRYNEKVRVRKRVVFESKKKSKAAFIDLAKESTLFFSAI